MTSHLGPSATAFVDGELSHERRDEVLAHLSHCASCRFEVDVLRRVKAGLRTVPGPAVSADLQSRLLAAAAASAPSSFLAESPRVRPEHSRLRRTAVGGALVAIGIGGALSLAGPAPRGPVAHVDPTSERFVFDHATVSGHVPFTEPELVSVASTLSTR